MWLANGYLFGQYRCREKTLVEKEVNYSLVEISMPL